MTAPLLNDDVQLLISQAEESGHRAEVISKMRLLAPLAALVAEIEGTPSMTPSKAKEQTAAVAEWRKASETLANLEEASASAAAEHDIAQTTAPAKATLFSTSTNEASEEVEVKNTATPVA